MSLGAIRLLFAGVWLLLAGGLFARRWLLPAAAGPQLDVAGLLAVGFAAWNVARWRQGRTRNPTARERRERPAGGERNPAFDFGGEASPDPSPKR